MQGFNFTIGNDQKALSPLPVTTRMRSTLVGWNLMGCSNGLWHAMRKNTQTIAKFFCKKGHVQHAKNVVSHKLTDEV